MLQFYCLLYSESWSFRDEFSISLVFLGNLMLPGLIHMPYSVTFTLSVYFCSEFVLSGFNWFCINFHKIHQYLKLSYNINMQPQLIDLHLKNSLKFERLNCSSAIAISVSTYHVSLKKYHIRETLNLSMCADSSADTKKQNKKEEEKKEQSMSHVMCHLSPVTCRKSPAT